MTHWRHTDIIQILQIIHTYIHRYYTVRGGGVIEGRREVHTSLAPPSAVTSCNPQSDWNINII